MKIIVIRGIGKIFTKIVVFKNGEQVAVCPMRDNYCEIDAKEGDKIVVGLKSIGNTGQVLASFVYHNGNDVLLICPTDLCRKWETANFMVLPVLCMLFFILAKAIESDACEWLFTGTFVLTVLSIICIQSCPFYPSLQNKMFRFDFL